MENYWYWKEFLRLWNREIKTNKITSFYTSLMHTHRWRHFTISDKLQDVALSFSKIFEKLPKTFVKFCNFSTEWKMTTLNIFSKDFSTLLISHFLLKIKWNVECIIVLCDLVLFAQFKTCEKHPWRNVIFSKVAG